MELTFACLHAIGPSVINILAAEASTVLEPSTAASATTEFAGFLDTAALGTQFAAYLAAYRGCARRCRRCCCGNVNVKLHETRAQEHANASTMNNRCVHHYIEAVRQPYRQL